MERYNPLVPKPEGPHGYFWTIWGDWNLVPKVGFAFVAIACIFTVVSQYPEIERQKKSFDTALTSLSGARLAKPVLQKQAKLLKTNNLYSWRAIVWIQSEGKANPWILRADVLRDGGNFRIVTKDLAPYEQGKAESLELYDRISPQ